MNKPIFLLALFFIIIVSGCVGQGGGQQQDNEKKELTSTITPARDLTGRWSGSAIYQDNALNPNCKYEGSFVFNFQQNGNNIQGNYALTITKPTQLLDTGLPCSPKGTYPLTTLAGTVSSSRIDFTDPSGNIFSGTFTTDLMTLNFESCPNNECGTGSYGVGIKGTTKLIRD